MGRGEAVGVKFDSSSIWITTVSTADSREPQAGTLLQTRPYPSLRVGAGKHCQNFSYCSFLTSALVSRLQSLPSPSFLYLSLICFWVNEDSPYYGCQNTQWKRVVLLCNEDGLRLVFMLLLLKYCFLTVDRNQISISELYRKMSWTLKSSIITWQYT